MNGIQRPTAGAPDSEPVQTTQIALGAGCPGEWERIGA